MDINSSPLSSDSASSEAPVKPLHGLTLRDDNRDQSSQSPVSMDAGNKRPSVQSASNSSMDPVNLPNGSIMLPPFPRMEKTEMINYPQENLPNIEWPEPMINHTIPRTRSFISQATTIAGVGSPIASSSSPRMDTAMLSSMTQTSRFSDDDYPEIDYLQLVLQASTRIYDVAIESPLQYAKNLSAKLGRENKVYLKREDMQPVCFSFKIRGAYNKISQLSSAQRSRGVICMSAGNHAQGVALSAQKLGIKAIIVMPVTASEIKVNSVRRLGATVILSGADLEEAKKECLRLAQDNGYVFVPPYDDPYIIAGQGTCGMEIIRQMRRGERLDAIFVPVGGGGLLSGIAAFIKRVAPEIKIIGVNTEDSTSMATSLQRRERTTMPSVGLFSDGTAVRQIGEETYRISANLVDDMVLVTVDEICAAIKDVFEDTRSILEPAGALGVAGIKKFLQGRGKNIQGGVFVAVTSGANMNFDRLRFVSERSRIGEGKECLLSCKVEEKPGSLMRLYSKIFPRSVTEVSYRYSDAIQAQIYVAFELSKGKEEIKSVVESINSDPSMTAIDITDNDLAKSHLRFLVGGRAPKSALGNEKLYRFSFPERPGAFRLFFEQLKNASAGRDLWGLTLFHYRNTGGDMARVLIGMDIPPEAEADGSLQLFLKSLGFSFVEETNNTVYQHFLR